MSKVVKIDKVYLYTSGTESTADEIAAKKIMDDSGMVYIELAYNDPIQHDSVYKALSTWYWGEAKTTRKFDKFPIVHWIEYYDDLYEMHFNTVGADELKKSSLLKNKKVVV